MRPIVLLLVICIPQICDGYSGRKAHRMLGIEHRLYQQYKEISRVEKLNFHLTFGQFKKYWQRSCFVCGKPVRALSITTLVPQYGYRGKNVISICPKCKRDKEGMTLIGWHSYLLNVWLSKKRQSKQGGKDAEHRSGGHKENPPTNFEQHP